MSSPTPEEDQAGDGDNNQNGNDHIHSNGVTQANLVNDGQNGGGGGGGDGVRKRKVAKQASNDETAPMCPEDLEDYIPEPPDGGWGWVIVFASMCNNLIVDGLCYSFGVFLLEFVNEFKASKSKVSLAGSLMSGTYLFAGPIVSAMTNRFGCRRVVIVGSIIATCGFLLATQVKNINLLILTHGVMAGFGFGMMYLPSIVSVGYYFQAKRAFATGIAVAGSGLGTFIFPPMCEYLLKKYSWRGTLFIIAGIAFNSCVAGALMRPLEATPKKKPSSIQPRQKGLKDRVKQYFNRSRSASESTTANKQEEIAARVEEAKLIREKKLQDNDSVPGSMSSVTVKRLDSTGTNDSRVIIPRSKQTSISSTATDLPSPGSEPPSPRIVIEFENEHGTKVSEDIIILEEPQSPDSKDGKELKSPGRSHKANQNETGKKSEIAPLLQIPGTSQGGSKVLPPGCGGSRTNLYHLSSLRSLNLSKKDLAKDLARPLYRKDIFSSANVLNVTHTQSRQSLKSYIASLTTLPGEKDYLDGPPSASAKFFNSCCSCLPRSARDVLSEMVDISLFKDISFMCICLGNFFSFLGFFVPFVFIVDKAVDIGIDKSSAAFLISIIGIANTIGRVVVGKLVDHKIVDSLVVSWTSILLCGVVTALMPFCNSYALLAVNATLFGTGMAAFISLSSILICDRMGVEKLTNAFGLMSLTRGLSGMAGPPLGGKLFDSTKNYNMSFFVAGAFLIIGGLFHVLLHLPCLKKAPVAVPQFTDIVMEEIDPEEAAIYLGEKEQPIILTVDEVSKHED